MKNTTSATNDKIKTDVVIELILKYIKDHNLEAGDRLPSERALAEMFGVTRPVIRNAALVLNVVNIIEIRQQGGMFVAEPSFNSRFDYFKLCMQSGKISMAEIFETRLIMEVECIALAAKNITDEQLDTLEETISSVSIYDPEAFSEADKKLHSIIYAATGNNALKMLMQTVSMWAVVTRKISNSYEEVRRIVHTDHTNIYQALRTRDAERCRETMRQHILHLRQIQHIEDTVLRNEFAQLNKEINQTNAADTADMTSVTG